MSVQRCMAETTSREFMEWRAYIRRDATRHHREDYYAAQIALEVHRVLKKNPNASKLKHFLLKFTTGEEQTAPPTEQQVEQRLQQSKAKWGAIVGTNYRVRQPPKE